MPGSGQGYDSLFTLLASLKKPSQCDSVYDKHGKVLLKPHFNISGGGKIRETKIIHESDGSALQSLVM